MNGASSLIVFVLLVSLVAGMVFVVDQLNRSAAEILANRSTIQELQNTLEGAQADQVRQQQLLADQAAALRQKDGELDAAGQALSAAQADNSALQRSLAAEQAARAAAEGQTAALREDLRALQAQAAEKTALQTPPAVSAPVAGGTRLPLALSAGGLLLAGGILLWGRHERHLVLPQASDRPVVVRMTRAQAHQYARFARAEQNPKPQARAN